MNLLFPFLITTQISALASYHGRVSLLPPAEVKPVESSSVNSSVKSSGAAKEKTQPVRKPNGEQTEPDHSSGNLPVEYTHRVKVNSLSENPILVPSQKAGLHFSQLQPGDVIEATILESAIAFSESKAPIRALIKSGPLKKSILLGEASLERNSKRILITFSKFRRPSEDTVYQVSASGLDKDGVLGVEGELHSGEATYFGAEFLAAGAAGYADSTVDRSQNALGNYVEAPTFSNATKKALASALTRTADRFSEKLKMVPEYAVLKGPIDIKVIITDEIKAGL